MPSVWLERRETARGNVRYLVKYRLGGRESAHSYAGSFATRREALASSSRASSHCSVRAGSTRSRPPMLPSS